jgi:hypothetical protein
LRRLMNERVSHDLIVEAIEDISLSRAIHEEEKSESASKKEIFDILEGRTYKTFGCKTHPYDH